MSQTTALSSPVTAAQLAAMDGEHIVKMGRELIFQLGCDPDRFNGNIWPGNIHFDDDGKAVLGEGSDAPVSAREPEQIEYMAPEAFWDNRFGREADLYSIALLMYTAYNGGRLPFTNSQTPADTERAQALRTRMKGGEIPMPEGASEAVAAILRRALSYDAQQRYLTADAMLSALGETDEALPSQAPEDEPVADPQAAAAAAAAGMAGVGLVAELAAIPREQVRPIEAQAGVSADSIVMEQQLNDLDRRTAAPQSAEEESLKDIFPQGEPTPAAETPEAPEEAEASVAPEAAEAASEPETVRNAEETEEPDAPKDAETAEAPEPSETAESAEAKDDEAEAKADEAEAKAAEAAESAPVKATKAPAKKGSKKKKKKTTPKPVAGIVDLAAEPTQEKDEKPAQPEAAEVLPETAAAAQDAPEKPEQKPSSRGKASPKESAQTSSHPAKNAAQSKPSGSGKKQYTVQKEIDRREEAAARRKNRGGAILAIGVGALVIAGLICVTAYSLGAFEKEEPVTLVTAEPTAEATAEPTASPVQEEALPAVPDYHFTATAADFDWDALENVGLAVLNGQDAFDAAVAAAEDAGLENAWLGARWLDGADAPDGEAGWYWLDGTQLPENSSFWAENEPSAESGGRLMMRREADGSWRFYAVTREQYESGEYESLGCITDGSGMAPIPTPAPTATPEPTPEPTKAPGSYTAYVPTYTTTATTAPTSAPAGGTTTTPSATSTPAATTAPEKYLAVAESSFWSGTSDMVVIGSDADFAAVTEFLSAYNAAHADEPLYNVWLGAEYKEADEETGLAAGWYWLNGTALSDSDAHWAAGQNTTDCKLMLRCVGDVWSYYAVSAEQFNENPAEYTNSGTLKVNPDAQ